MIKINLLNNKISQNVSRETFWKNSFSIETAKKFEFLSFALGTITILTTILFVSVSPTIWLISAGNLFVMIAIYNAILTNRQILNVIYCNTKTK